MIYDLRHFLSHFREPAYEEVTMTTGTDVLRQALRARKNYAMIAKEMQVPKLLLEDFVAGSRTLPPKVLQDLTTFIFGGLATYDETIDRLRSANTAEPTPLGVKPPVYQPPKVDYTLPRRGPQPLYPPTKSTPKAQRPGWVE